MIEITATCDACGADLSSTGNCVDYRLRLESERLPPQPGAVTAMMIYPPVDRPYIFCGLRCLDVWRGQPTAAPLSPTENDR